ncbi:MAG: ATP-binding protein [Gemmatimonadetes bacterium]|nr:ATP-binding protein [Gemmatimonadota bacterium]MYG22694.1 ATP-binding protein [Gemmatimonadota bacterium]MYJ38169.1 ATP-binding protein [Gemmatimonadota bacterium]
MLISRHTHLADLRRKLANNPVVALLGARQVGKTTLAKALAVEMGTAAHFDLEDPRDLARLDEPTLTLEPLQGLVIIDEVQHRPDLFPVLRVLADRTPPPARFLVLGSASPALLRQGAESLAGRLGYHELGGLDLAEVGADRWERLWLRGGFPRSWLAPDEVTSQEWRRDFIRSFVERDLPGFGITLPSRLLHDFWTMLAHYHGQTWNGSELARAFGLAHTTVRRYLDIMTGAYVVRQLRPWRENLGKRIVKASRVYIADSGLLHTLLGVETRQDLRAHPKVGASWEGFALEQVVRQLQARPEECHFWSVHSGPELDLLVVRGQRRLGYEFKRTDAPSVNRSMRTAMRLLRLSSLDIVHVGNETFPLADGIRALAGQHILAEIEPLRR